MGSFRLLESNKDTNDLVYPGLFDTYAFELETNDGIVDALELDFTGNFLQAGGTTFKPGAANPIVFGFEAPDTFFILPPGAAQLAANVSDTATELRAAWTTEGALPIVPGNGTKTPVAFFSLAAGSPAPTFAALEVGKALIGGIENTIVEAGGTVNIAPTLTSQSVDIDLRDFPGAAVVSATLVATDDAPLSELDWMLNSFTTPDGSPPLSAPTFNADTGLFTWDANGNKEGAYVASIKVTDAGGLMATGSLTINVTVPEPSTVALCSLAMVGLVGLIRRRS
jgi:hypothetical protein